jgi:hypothetical protein
MLRMVIKIDEIKKSVLIFIFLLSLLVFSSCSSLWGNSYEVDGLVITETPTPFLPESYLPTQTEFSFTSIPDITPLVEQREKFGIWISDTVPILLRQSVVSSDMQFTDDPSVAILHLDIRTEGYSGQTTWIYALVAPFPTIVDDITWDELQRAWKGINEESSFAGIPLWMDENTLGAFSAIWGEPATGSVRTASREILIDSAWSQQPSWGIVPFEEIEPRWKVLSIDGNSPISNEFNSDKYPLRIAYGFQEGESPKNIILPESNRDPEKLTTLVMTGVTALVRATAAKMERNGVLYPGIDIRSWLLSADLTHISNEISFSDSCPYPDPNQTTLVFCSDPKYITLMEDVGTNIVELTGNHFQDWGSEATLMTLDMYNQRGWIYFGGGTDLMDARAAKLIEHNGNKLAFIGCNPAGPQYAWATDSQPGAAPCDYDWMRSEISRLVSNGFLPIVTFQYIESYSVHPLPEQMDDFRSMAASGAVIVSGSQAHLPQTMEFLNGSFIHYGLGNLFFDQMDFPVVGTRQEFIDRHVIYDGKYIATELLTAILEDYSRPRPMTQEERTYFLSAIYDASGW